MTTTTSGVFELSGGLAFFNSIRRTYLRYRSGTAKSTEDLLYVIMGLNHLREWIAPKFEKNRDGTWPKCDSDEKRFSKKVYDNSNHTAIRAVCNATKHCKAVNTGAVHNMPIDDWPDIDSVTDFDRGPTAQHLVDGSPVENVIDPVMQLYADWFKTHP